MSSSTGGSKLRHIIFIIIESGMALFAIQLVRLALNSVIQMQSQAGNYYPFKPCNEQSTTML